MKRLLPLLFVVVFTLQTAAQRINPWQKSTKNQFENAEKLQRTTQVSEFDIVSLDLQTLKNQLIGTPKRGNSVATSSHQLYFPDADGTMKLFRVYEASVMHPDLQAQVQNIKSFVGVCIDDRSTLIRFSVTIFGFHGMIMSPRGTVYIDPYTTDLSTYIVYKKKNAIAGSSFECLTDSDEVSDETPVHFSPRNGYDIESNTGIFRTYRLAMACTIEYAQFHWQAAGMTSGTPEATRKEAVLAAMNVSMTRINGIFERDMSLTMELVPTNLNVIFITSDNFDNNDAGVLINQSQSVINSIIGSTNYDIGHTVSTGGGGLAQLNSPCTTGKARGITGAGAPVGDPFDVDYVAHEMGHQFGATHTQNNDCNRTNSTAVEPGSASTIMGYAGICGPNVQNNSDDHFHAVSLAQMDNFVAGTGNCSENIVNNNSAPVINPIPNYIIPRSTPFILPGNATDADGDTLTYCWEQTDNQTEFTHPPQPNYTSGPIFRSLSPSLSPDRYMPTINTVLAGLTANTWEVVPSVARTMNFALVVRDNELVNGGQTARRDMTVTTASVGPFVVNSPNTNVNWLAGSNQNVTWDVAGTTANGINAATVDIFLSTNGGTSFPILVASNVPNDGSETITLPNTVGTQNRIMVRGNNHIFYDVSNTNFTISAATPTFSLAFDGLPDGQNKEICQGQSVAFDLNYQTIGGFSGNTTFSVSGNPSGSTVSFSPSSISSTGTVQMTLADTENTTAGFYTIIVTGTSGAITKTVNLYLDIRSTTFDAITPINPLDFANGISNQAVYFEWNSDSNATSYDFQLAEDVEFNSIIVSQNTTTNEITASSLAESTNYFWRVLPKNDNCQGEMSPVFRFTTGSGLSCDPIVNSTNIPIPIPAFESIVNSTLTIPSNQNNVISKVTVSLDISHTFISDLIVSLISPQNTEIVLFSNKCSNRDDANVTFDDEGITLTCSASFPTISGTVMPEEPLSAFNGENSEGVWTLKVNDTFDEDGGSINNWGLTICTVDDSPIACGEITSTWNGTTWSNGYPVNNVAAIINDDLLIDSTLECCSMTIGNNATVTLQSGNNLVIENELTVDSNSSFTVENNANLIQINEIQNTGDISVIRNTNPLMRLDYVIWSSPVTGIQTLKEFSPFTMNNRFYNYVTNSNIYTAVANPLTTEFEEGTGYLIRMPDNHPTTPTIWTGQFDGVPKNGTIEVDLIHSSATQKYNAIGNPYPSTISAEAFLLENASDIEGTLYFWRKTNNAAGTAYATYTLGGATTTSPTSPIPNGTIQVGQGFLVASQNVANPTAMFLNSMRVDNNSNQSFRSGFGLPYAVQTDLERHRFWLNLSSSVGHFSQMMVGYIESATNEVDHLIDGKYIGDNPIALTSIIADEEFVIQGRALPFVSSDVVPLQFRTNNSGEFTISIANSDGLFENEQVIYVRDNQLGIIHNLKESDYTFTTEAGIFESRFDIVYQDDTLSIGNLSLHNEVLVATGNNQLQVQSSDNRMEEIVVFDILGRLLFENKKVHNTTYSIPGLLPHKQTLLIKITLENGEKITKKVIF